MTGVYPKFYEDDDSFYRDLPPNKKGKTKPIEGYWKKWIFVNKYTDE